jgi:hypothetical protein
LDVKKVVTVPAASSTTTGSAMSWPATWRITDFPFAAVYVSGNGSESGYAGPVKRL